jgi:hypothetical protein
MLTIAMLYWLLPPAVLAGAFAATRMAGLAPAAILATLLSGAFWMLICYGMRIPAIYGLAYPIGALMALYIVLRSTWRGGRRVEWRGRVYGEKKAVNGER